MASKHETPKYVKCVADIYPKEYATFVFNKHNENQFGVSQAFDL